jgi:hypothetical protein
MFYESGIGKNNQKYQQFVPIYLKQFGRKLTVRHYKITQDWFNSIRILYLTRVIFVNIKSLYTYKLPLTIIDKFVYL